MLSVDLNCDMGESFGVWRMGDDEALMNVVSSVNIACGFHAGDPSVMRRTVAMAASKNLAIGAHPGFADMQGFGRRTIALTPGEVYDIMVYQIGALAAFAVANGTRLRHVKPHGALYNMAAANKELAASVVRAVQDVDRNLVLVGLSGSLLISEAERAGLKAASEVFADRMYQDDGTLTPRSSPNALITDPRTAAKQVLRMVLQKSVVSLSGKIVPVRAETVCVHGDGAHAVEFARAVVDLLTENHVAVKSF
jgi:5-oxoprolinase (ATP-hydrolysing) subunit A